MFRELHFCYLCQIGQPGDEYHLVFGVSDIAGGLSLVL